MTIYYPSCLPWVQNFEAACLGISGLRSLMKLPSDVGWSGVILKVPSLMCGIWAEKPQKVGTAEAPHASVFFSV